jgi:hypothetical protein
MGPMRVRDHLATREGHNLILDETEMRQPVGVSRCRIEDGAGDGSQIHHDMSMSERDNNRSGQ